MRGRCAPLGAARRSVHCVRRGSAACALARGYGDYVMEIRQGATQVVTFARAAPQDRLRRTPLLSRQNWVVF